MNALEIMPALNEKLTKGREQQIFGGAALLWALAEGLTGLKGFKNSRSVQSSLRGMGESGAVIMQWKGGR